MKRLLTAVVGIPLVVLITLYAPFFVFAPIVGVFAALAVEEFLKLGSARGLERPGRWFLVLAWVVTVSFHGETAFPQRGAEWVASTFVFSVIVLMTVSAFSAPLESALSRVALGLSALAYCSLTLGFLIWLAPEEVVVLFGIIWTGDGAAYYGGRLFGRHLLAPKISPKKTIEGGIAGLAGSIIAGVLLGSWMLAEPLGSAALISGVAAIAGQIGDLAESALKRSAGVKDSSSILPGHGGILDRLDSLFFAAPVFYWLFSA